MRGVKYLLSNINQLGYVTHIDSNSKKTPGFNIEP